jgi:hypothetical protein
MESSRITNDGRAGNGSIILRNPILTKLFLQFLGDNYTYNTLIRHKIIGTLKYVNDKINYTTKLTDTNLTLQEFNKIQPNLQLTMEKEQKQQS